MAFILSVEGLPTTPDAIIPESEEPVPDVLAAIQTTLGFSDDAPDADPMSESPTVRAMAQGDDPMAAASGVPDHADEWEKFALRHENKVEMEPSDTDKSLATPFKHVLGEKPGTNSTDSSNPAAYMGQAANCAKLGQHLCGDGTCSKDKCATSMPNTADPFMNSDPKDHQPLMQKAVSNSGAKYAPQDPMSTENEAGVPSKMPPVGDPLLEHTLKTPVAPPPQEAVPPAQPAGSAEYSTAATLFMQQAFGPDGSTVQI